MFSHPAVGRQYMDLPVVAPGIRCQQGIDHCPWRIAGSQTGHAMDGIHRIDQRLRGQRANPGFKMDRQRPDREEPRGDGGTQRSGDGITGEDRPCHVQIPSSRRD